MLFENGPSLNPIERFKASFTRAKKLGTARQIFGHRASFNRAER